MLSSDILNDEVIQELLKDYNVLKDLQGILLGSDKTLSKALIDKTDQIKDRYREVLQKGDSHYV